MDRLLVAAMILVAPLAVNAAAAADLDAQTSCRQFAQMSHDDSQPGSDQAVKRRHVVGLVNVIRAYILRGPDGKPVPAVVRFLISEATAWCSRNPDRNFGEAAQFAGQREAAVVAGVKRQRMQEQGATDRDARQLVGLFAQSCMRFVDNPPGLREWVALHGLPMVPAAQATAFLRGHAGQVFGAGKAARRDALISYDSGACEVFAMFDNPSAVQQALLEDLHQEGMTTAAALERAKPDHSAAQEIYRASLDGTHWLLSITAHSHRETPALPPEVEILATIDRGFAASDQ